MRLHLKHGKKACHCVSPVLSVRAHRIRGCGVSPLRMDGGTDNALAAKELQKAGGPLNRSSLKNLPRPSLLEVDPRLGLPSNPLAAEPRRSRPASQYGMVTGVSSPSSSLSRSPRSPRLETLTRHSGSSNLPTLDPLMNRASSDRTGAAAPVAESSRTTRSLAESPRTTRSLLQAMLDGGARTQDAPSKPVETGGRRSLAAKLGMVPEAAHVPASRSPDEKAPDSGGKLPEVTNKHLEPGKKLTRSTSSTFLSDSKGREMVVPTHSAALLQAMPGDSVSPDKLAHAAAPAVLAARSPDKYVPTRSPDRATEDTANPSPTQGGTRIPRSSSPSSSSKDAALKPAVRSTDLSALRRASDGATPSIKPEPRSGASPETSSRDAAKEQDSLAAKVFGGSAGTLAGDTALEGSPFTPGGILVRCDFHPAFVAVLSRSRSRSLSLSLSLSPRPSYLCDWCSVSPVKT